MENSWKKQFITIYAGQAFSLLGSAAVQFAVIWWLTDKTESAITLTIASIAAFLPNMLLGPFAGVWIDRFNRRTVMIAADGLVALSSVVLGLVFLFTDSPSVWVIYAILFVRGVGNTFHGPAMQAAIPMLVPVEMLTKAGGWGNMINSISTMLGPVLGGLLMSLLPMSPIMLVDILGAALAIICLLFVKIPDIPRSAQKPNFGDDFRQGFAAIKANRPLMAVFFPLLLSTVIYMPLSTLFPLLVKTHFAGTAWHNSIVELVFSLGLMVSSMIIGVWGGMKRRFFMFSLSIVGLGLTSAISGALPGGAFWAFVVLCFIMGGTGTFFNVPFISYVQESTPPESMGKVFSLLMTAMTLSMPIGLIIAGPVAEAIGADSWFFWSGIAMIATGILSRIMTRPYDEQTMIKAAPEASE